MTVVDLQMIETFALKSTRVCEISARAASSTNAPVAILTAAEAMALRPDLNTLTENSYAVPAIKKSGGKLNARLDVKFNSRPFASLQETLRSPCIMPHCHKNCRAESIPGPLKSGSNDEDASMKSSD